jgi:hypothetical protein
MLDLLKKFLHIYKNYDMKSTLHINLVHFSCDAIKQLLLAILCLWFMEEPTCSSCRCMMQELGIDLAWGSYRPCSFCSPYPVTVSKGIIVAPVWGFHSDFSFWTVGSFHKCISSVDSGCSPLARSIHGMVNCYPPPVACGPHLCRPHTSATTTGFSVGAHWH